LSSTSTFWTLQSSVRHSHRRRLHDEELTALAEFPIFLTTWHLIFATIMTQILARFTTILDSRKKVPMTGKVYLRAIVPIGLFFSLSLICGNQAYLYLSVAFIQMLKVRLPDSKKKRHKANSGRLLPPSLSSLQPGVWE